MALDLLSEIDSCGLNRLNFLLFNIVFFHHVYTWIKELYPKDRKPGIHELFLFTVLSIASSFFLIYPAITWFVYFFTCKYYPYAMFLMLCFKIMPWIRPYLLYDCEQRSYVRDKSVIKESVNVDISNQVHAPPSSIEYRSENSFFRPAAQRYSDIVRAPQLIYTQNNVSNSQLTNARPFMQKQDFNVTPESKEISNSNVRAFEGGVFGQAFRNHSETIQSPSFNTSQNNVNKRQSSDLRSSMQKHQTHLFESAETRVQREVEVPKQHYPIRPCTHFWEHVGTSGDHPSFHSEALKMGTESLERVEPTLISEPDGGSDGFDASAVPQPSSSLTKTPKKKSPKKRQVQFHKPKTRKKKIVASKDLND